MPEDTSEDSRETPRAPEDFRVFGDGGAFFAALAKAQGSFLPLHKTKTVKVRKKDGGEYTFDYAPLDEVLKAVRPALASAGLCVSQPPGRCELESGEWILRTIVAGEVGGCESIIRFRPAGDIKDFGSMLTYLRRYAITSLLGLAADDDDDAGAATGDETVPVPRQQPKPKAKPREKPSEPGASSEQLREVGDLIKAAGLNRIQAAEFAYEKIGVADASQLTETQAAKLIEELWDLARAKGGVAQ